ncbi:MAG: galactofuranosylgalactofuranosylrhamnosyl-N-acetylglucosaminyl-diphospho-decaprenol [Nocardioidaceae bacterium]|jgi:galactofuranosylgalactofuranosylrhamnosyl-N-acetylglucosaminyl-diphospho-decaprenol beta-1,5/1,6-galactofuranosyltransferase|nr:galactofuranosylgalactofuranosylrhamnosyl-N-acetylglucosaminyl-diphospho-decaprenol [Nocardioidaceae bacterium]
MTLTVPVAGAAEEAAQARGLRVVQRTILRADQELDIRPLYVTGLSSFSGGESTSRQSGAGDASDGPVPGSAEAREAGNYGEKAGESAGSTVEGLGAFGKITGELGATALPQRRITFGTYFNAFPASYWRRWTDQQTVRLVCTISGQGTLIVYRSTAKGHVQRADAAVSSSEQTTTVEFDLPLKPFIDGGWYWFDIEAGDEPMRLHTAVWGFETEKTQPGTVSIGITTFNRPDFCVDQLQKIADDASVLEILDEILVVDQGTQRVANHPEFDEAQSRLGMKLRLIEQGNLGGSGGFSRAMNEVVSKGIADYVLLLDDDVVCELEGILRAVAFADLAKTPTMVGGQMFSLYDRSVMHAFGETVAKYRWFWGPAPHTLHGHNWAVRPLRSTSWLHRRVDVDYNGWWMCLIPTKVIKEVGLALPMFIKWDDAEFGLRARDAGYPTVTLPGVAVWHVPWHEKDDTIDWQAYFHRRNRIITALLHSPYERGGRLILESFETQIKHLFSMQYGPAEMGLMAIEDILEGPQRMHRDVLKRLPELFELRKGYDDSRAQTDLDVFPPAGRRKPPRRGKEPSAPKTRLARAKTMAASAVRQVLPVRSMARERPEANVPHIDLKWWLLAQFDSALVSSADGSAAAWYKRDPELFRDLLARSIALHTQLVKEWPNLVEQYTAALAELSSPDTWKSTFDASIKEDEPVS